MKLQTVTAGITKYLKGLRQRERALEGYLNRNVLRQYQNLQRKRWITENVSEGKEWAKLNPTYAAWKKKRFATYPGGGTKKLIASGTLFVSVIGPGKGFRKVTTPRSLYLATTIEYARHVNEARPFDQWSDRSRKEILNGISRFIFKGIQKSVSDLA